MANPINKKYLTQRFRKSLKTYDKTAVVQEQMACRLLELLDSLKGRDFPRVFEFGTGSGMLTRRVIESLLFNQLYVNDIVNESEVYVKKISDRLTFLPGDIEAIALPPGLDLVIANASVQWLTAPGALFAKVSQALNPNGIFAFTSFGPDNYQEVSAVSSQRLTYYPEPELRRMLKPWYSILHFEEEIKTIPFASPTEVLKHIKDSGTNSLAPMNWKKKDLNTFKKEYLKLFRTEYGVQLTYHPYYFVLENKR